MPLTALEGRADAVAPLLLGALLHGRGVTLRLTEVEAYLGVGEDPGSHAHRGVTPRTRVMFGPPGRLYVYRSYGIHACANVVCSPTGTASAVLLRAGEVVDGIEVARERRPTARRDADLARGPGRLTLALGIDLADDGADFADDGADVANLSDLGADRLRLKLPDSPPPAVMTGPRVGVSGAAGTAEFPLRFWIPGDPTVSVYRPGTARADRPRGSAGQRPSTP